MKNSAVIINQYVSTKLSPVIVGLAIGLAFLSVPVYGQSNANDSPSAAETEALRNFEIAKAAGRHAEATQYILEYMEETDGENAPLTVTLTHRYGNLLRDEGDIRAAVSMLKKARKRGIVAYGEHGMPLFEINLDLGDVYVDRDIGIRRPIQYFNDALEVLRENGQRETILYVNALVGIASRLTQGGALDGALAADTAGSIGMGDLIGSGMGDLTHGYASGYWMLEGYLREAVELAEVLASEDPYLSAKIAIVQAKIKVTETLLMEIVPPSIKGNISGTTARKYYDQQDSHLSSAIDLLMADAGQNKDFLDIAKGARMDIAWLSEDMERMANFCSSNTLNMASRYPPDRLFEIEDDGSVIAPGFSFWISSNIFKRQRRGGISSGRDPSKLPEKSPQFVPVCIDGRLMAVLINAPKVTIEEID